MGGQIRNESDSSRVSLMTAVDADRAGRLCVPFGEVAVVMLAVGLGVLHGTADIGVRIRTIESRVRSLTHDIVGDFAGDIVEIHQT